MRLDELKPNQRTKSAKRVGRGLGSGKGKTSGRGMSGQKSRSGYNLPAGFEGGQTTIIERMPKKRGFGQVIKKYIPINIANIIEYYKDGEEISPETLIKKDIISSAKKPVKLFGKTDKKFVIKNCKVSKSLEQLLVK